MSDPRKAVQWTVYVSSKNRVLWPLVGSRRFVIRSVEVSSIGIVTLAPFRRLPIGWYSASSGGSLAACSSLQS